MKARGIAVSNGGPASDSDPYSQNIKPNIEKRCVNFIYGH